MRAGVKWLALVVVSCLAEAGCAVDAGVRGGATFAKEGGSGNLSGGVGASIKYPLTGPGWTLGTEVQGRGEMERGSRWLGGLRVGYAHPPDPYRGAQCCGWELRAEGGTTLESATLFTRGAGYLGVTGEVLMGGVTGRNFSDVNDEPWILAPLPEVGLAGGARYLYLPNAIGTDADHRLDLSAGLTLRVRFSTEFIDL